MIWLNIESTDHSGEKYTAQTPAYFCLESHEWLNESHEPIHGIAAKPDFAGMDFGEMVVATSPNIPVVAK